MNVYQQLCIYFGRKALVFVNFTLGPLSGNKVTQKQTAISRKLLLQLEMKIWNQLVAMGQKCQNTRKVWGSQFTVALRRKCILGDRKLELSRMKGIWGLSLSPPPILCLYPPLPPQQIGEQTKGFRNIAFTIYQSPGFTNRLFLALIFQPWGM